MSLTLAPLVLHEDSKGEIFFPYGAPRLAVGDAVASILQRFADRSRPLGTEIRILGETARVELR